MADNKAPLSDGQDQTGAEIKRLKRSVSILSVCVLIQAFNNLILSYRIDKILGLLKLFVEFNRIVTKVMESLIYTVH